MPQIVREMSWSRQGQGNTHCVESGHWSCCVPSILVDIVQRSDARKSEPGAARFGTSRARGSTLILLRLMVVNTNIPNSA